MEKALEFGKKNFQHFIDDLKSLVRIPSISFPGFPKEELDRSAEAVAAHFRECGLENVELLRFEDAPPYVYADWLHAPGAPTVLLYAHHDVQPVGKTELWKSPPFEPTERDGRLWGRGAADDKAGLLVHSSAVRSYLQTEGKLPINVKFLIEGEEEVGSGHLEKFLHAYRSKFSADVMILTDTSNVEIGVPTITNSLRGLVVLQVEVRALKQSVHSGAFGGPTPDPVIAFSKMVSSLVDDQGCMTIPGIYDDVPTMTDKDRESMEALKYGPDQIRKEAGFLPGVQVVGGPAPALEKMTRLPSLSVNAIEASSRKAAANVINASCWAKMAIRVAPGQDAVRVEKKFREAIEKAVPWGLEVSIHTEACSGGWMTDTDHPAFGITQAAMQAAYGKETVLMGAGGSIPFVGPFAQALGGAPALLMGVEDPYTNAHSENESLHLADFEKAILGAIRVYQAYADNAKALMQKN